MALNIGELTGFLNLDPSKFQGGVKDALGSLKSKDWKVAGAAAGAAAAAALAVGFKGAVDMQASTKKVAAQLNLTADEAEKAGKAAGELYAGNIGKSMEDTNAIIASVMSNIDGMRDASQEDLQEMSTYAYHFADTMGTSVSDATKTVGTLLREGMVEDANQGFDVMARAATEAGPDMVEPLLDATKKFGPRFAEMGLDGEQTMGILAAASKNGSQGIDAAGRSVRRMGDRLTDLNNSGAQDALGDLGLEGQELANQMLEGGDAAQEATGTITEALLSVEDPAEQAALAGKLFGQDLRNIGKENLPEFLEALGGAGDGLSDVDGAMADMSDTANDTLQDSLETLGRGVQIELVDMMKDAVDWLRDASGGLDNLVQYVKPAVLALGGFAAVIGAVNLGMKAYQAALAIQKGAMAVATAAQWAWNAALTANPIGIVVMAIAGLVAGLVLFFTKTEAGQAIWEKVWGGIKTAAAAVWDWVKGTLWPGLLAAWDAISAGAIWLYENGIKPAWDGISTAIGAVVDWITGTVWPALQTAWEAIGSAAKWLYESVIQPVWTGIKLAIAVVVTAISLYIDYIVFMFENVLAPVALWLYRNVIKPAWDGISAAIGAVVSWFRDTAWPILSSVIDWVANAFTVMRDKLSAAWTFIKDRVINPVISWFQNTAWPFIQRTIKLIEYRFGQFRYKLAQIWQFVKTNIINPVVAWFRDTAWPILERAINWITDAFTTLRNKLGDVWSFIRDNIIEPVVSWFTDTVKPKIDTVTGNIADAFDTMKSGIQKAWDAIKDAARAPVRFVVEDVYNDTLRSTFNGVADKLNLDSKWRLPSASVGFATGGIMPGYTPGKDVHSFYSPTAGRLDLSGGEPILRPEAGKVLGAGWVHGINAAARSGGTGGVSSFLGADQGHQAFAGGGIWGRVSGAASGAWDWISDKASTITNALTDPLGTLTKLAGKATDLIPGGGMFREMTVQTGKNVAEAVGDWLGGKTEPEAGNVGTGGSLAWASQLARKYGLTMTSGYRPGARTSSGSLSMHGLNRARDFSNSTGPTPEMMQFALAVLRGSRPTELLYTPLGALNMHRGGRQYANTGATARGHYNHVHVAYKRGGIYDALNGDVGGYAKGTASASPGWHMIGEQGPELVRFRGGEQVKTATETQEHMGRRMSVTNHFHEVGGEAAEIAARRVQNRMLQSAREAVRL